MPPTRLRRFWISLWALIGAGTALPAADWTIEVRGPAEAGGQVLAALYDDPIVYAQGGRPTSVRSVPWEGGIATLVFWRELGVSGTPSFFINGRFISGAQPFEAFQAIIDEELDLKGVSKAAS